MEQKIYKSSFRTGPDATKKQQMLFATDTAYALSEGYNCIEDSQGVLFQILNEHNLVELGEADECECDCCLKQEPTITNFTPKNEGFTPLGNLAAIDTVISNTLNQTNPLRADQIDSLLKLGQLRVLLYGSAV